MTVNPPILFKSPNALHVSRKRKLVAAGCIIMLWCLSSPTVKGQDSQSIDVIKADICRAPAPQHDDATGGNKFALSGNV